MVSRQDTSGKSSGSAKRNADVQDQRLGLPVPLASPTLGAESSLAISTVSTGVTMESIVREELDSCTLEPTRFRRCTV
eukprot:scaffold1340_cov253-Pinguiococcus_pyrenoidosus.AAC.16